MFRTLTAAAALATLSTFTMSSAFAQASAPAAHAKPKAAAKKPAAKAKAAEAATGTNDNLSAGQLAAADRVLTGVADCDMKEKVDVEKIPGHNGNFKVVYAHKTYTMVPEETTTGAVRLVDTSGAVVWIQIPAKSMLMNQKEHHRLVDGCQEPEQRVTAQPPAATGGVAPGSTITTTTTTTTTMQVVPPAPVKNGSATPAAAASGMWK